jgi:hypothetical protein
MVKQNPIANLYLISKKVAGLKVAHSVPVFSGMGTGQQILE